MVILSVGGSPGPGPRTRQTGPTLVSKNVDYLRAPLRNRTVDLLLTIATLSRPGRTSCTDSTPERTGSTGCTQYPFHSVHDSFHGDGSHWPIASRSVTAINGGGGGPMAAPRKRALPTPAGPGRP